MDRRQFLAGATLGITAATAGCTSAVLESEGTGPDTGAAGTDDTEITVSATGEVEAEPDRATMRVGVEATGETAEDVTDELAADAEALRDAFDDLGIPDEDVEEGRYDVRPERDGNRFEGVHTFQLTLEDVDRVGEVIDASIAAGADDVGQVHFGLREETRGALRGEAIDEALANADDEAAHIAANRNVEITGTKAVTTDDVRTHSVRYAADGVAEADDAAAPPTEIDADPVTVTASVTAVYRFTD